MKKIMIIIAAVLLALSTGTQAFAKSEQMGNAEVDASLVYATPPGAGLFGSSAFDSTIGLAIGGGMMVEKDLQARVDITFLSFDGPFSTTYSRVPVTVSARYYMPTDQTVKLYGQGGLEMSFDKVEMAVPWFFPGFKTSESSINLGLVGGVGVDVAISPQLSFVADARLHVITDYYFTLQGGVAVHF